MFPRQPLLTKLTKPSHFIRPILTTRHFRTTSLAMGDDQPKIITAYPELTDIKAQQQKLPGKDVDMDPLAEFTKLETWDDDGKPYLKEYAGSGKLKGKKAIITGGDSGIGRAAAQMLAREGADVTIVYLPEEEEDAQRVKKAIEQDGQQCLTIAHDLMQADKAADVVKQHMDKFGKLDILVNNASKQIMSKSITEIELENVESTFRSNILAMFALTKAAVPHLKRGSAIINTSSVTAFKGSATMVDYASTKGAIVAYTRALAVQLAPQGIRVNGVCPGPVYTPLQPASRPADNMEGWSVGGPPLHGRASMPAEMGPAYVFLASSDANAMTGHFLHLNNGQWLG
ncbi:oxidoreductase [Cryptococcus neoformans C23]|uniref:Oxidoreductase n=2 Tax=Cryptococcus neoformans TaxID=5207 RepID=A0A854QCA3_CRYNE|nr:oxidoreductase [Cryptococcus neoformans var. grubii H99]AUB24786.1 oxidoreductase [Cryptococcus neoformans var. grubii]OWZ32498.1 oxidoreductase [Cryptococcus neoformans var. grubii AD2-60a]OWZ44020.1 oxidoreductase [Cryptococcus neoformans var. grubii AD1-83a]OWZ44345.1 oxidoreductase [Cryptococcus neoformans var. grubii C23]OWZ57638.1 oxidoreductase [Cryptococcus neoformans var. grubii 125.91]OXC84814.1 oxidoreductase [Cryptococcus neoformans var. grubii AD1-7a]OXG21931.1 oxidoreductase|eukprot:XP_012049060.1 oxidoreductase [Cryptococcus neoformans var. grubii H99]